MEHFDNVDEPKSKCFQFFILQVFSAYLFVCLFLVGISYLKNSSFW